MEQLLMGYSHLDDLRSTSMDSGVPFVMTILTKQMPMWLVNSWASPGPSLTEQVPVEGTRGAYISIQYNNYFSYA